MTLHTCHNTKFCDGSCKVKPRVIKKGSLEDHAINWYNRNPDKDSPDAFIAGYKYANSTKKRKLENKVIEAAIEWRKNPFKVTDLMYLVDQLIGLK